MIKAKQSHTISGVFVFFLLGVFAVASTLMVLLAAQAYRNGIDRADAHNAERIAAAYLRGKLREADSRGRLAFDELDGAASLRIDNPEEDTVTLLFVQDNMLYEWYTFRDLYDEAEKDPATGAPVPVQPDGQDEEEWETEDAVRGESICALDEMRLSLSGRTLTVNMRNGGIWTAVDIALRSAPQ